MMRTLIFVLTTGLLLGLCSCRAEQPSSPTSTGNERPKPKAKKPDASKVEKKPVQSADGKRVAFAVAWCTDPDPEKAAKTAAAGAIKDLGCPPKGLIFYEYFPKTVAPPVVKDGGDGEKPVKEAPVPEKQPEVPVPEKKVEVPTPKEEEGLAPPENEAEVPSPEKQQDVPVPEKKEEAPVPGKEDGPPAPQKKEETPVPGKEDGPPAPEKQQDVPVPERQEDVPDLDKEKRVLPAIGGVAASVPVIGCRARSLVTGGTMLSDTVAVLAIGGDDISCKVAKAKLEVDRKAVGTSIAKQLGDVKDLKLVMALSEMSLSFDTSEGVSVEDFIRGVLETAGKDVTLFGGNCMPNNHLTDDRRGVEFIDDEALSGHVVAMGIGGPVAVHANHTNEFSPSEETVTVTKAEDKWVVELDGQPAEDVYRKIRGMPPDEQFTSDWQHPIGVVVTPVKVYLRMIMNWIDRDGRDRFGIPSAMPPGSLEFVAAVPVGTKVKILKGGKDPEAILESAKEGTVESLQKAGKGKPLLALLSDCCARGMRLRELSKVDRCEIREAILPAISSQGKLPIFGFYAWGELGPIAGQFNGLPWMYQQHTFVSALLTEEK